MYPLHQLLNEWWQAKTKLQESFKPSEPASIVPMRAMLQKAFRSIALLAAKAHNAEQQWVLRLISEIEAEIKRIKNALSECGEEWNDWKGCLPSDPRWQPLLSRIARTLPQRSFRQHKN